MMNINTLNYDMDLLTSFIISIKDFCRKSLMDGFQAFFDKSTPDCPN